MCAGAGPRRVRHGVRGRARAGREERGHQARGQGQGLGVGRGELDTGYWSLVSAFSWVISCAMSCSLVMMSKLVVVLADVFMISSAGVSCVKSYSYMCSLVYDVLVVSCLVCFLCLYV